MFCINVAQTCHLSSTYNMPLFFLRSGLDARSRLEFVVLNMDIKATLQKYSKLCALACKSEATSRALPYQVNRSLAIFKTLSFTPSKDFLLALNVIWWQNGDQNRSILHTEEYITEGRTPIKVISVTSLGKFKPNSVFMCFKTMHRRS